MQQPSFLAAQSAGVRKAKSKEKKPKKSEPLRILESNMRFQSLPPAVGEKRLEVMHNGVDRTLEEDQYKTVNGRLIYTLCNTRARRARALRPGWDSIPCYAYLVQYRGTHEPSWLRLLRQEMPHVKLKKTKPANILRPDLSVASAICKLLLLEEKLPSGATQATSYTRRLLRDEVSWVIPYELIHHLGASNTAKFNAVWAKPDTNWSYMLQYGTWRTVTPASIAHIPDFEWIFTVEDQEWKRYPIIQLLWKGLPIRNVSRTLDAVTMPLFKYNAWIRRVVIEIIACGLLGNYPHIPDKAAAQTPVRCLLLLQYHLALHHLDPDASFYALLIRWAKHLCIFSIQQYLIFRIHQRPDVKDYCLGLFQLEKWSAHVDSAMTYARRYFAKNLALLTSGKDEDFAKFFGPLNLELSTRFRAQKQFCFRRPSTNFVGKVLSCIKTIVPVGADGSGRTVKTLWISQEQLDAMREFIDLQLPTTTYPEQLMFECIRHCGADPEAIRELRRKVVAFEEDGYKAGRLFKQFSAQYPHTYALVQAFATLWKRHSGVRTFRLPRHYLEGQLAAIRRRYGMKAESTHIPRGSAMFLFCPICRRIGTFIRDISTRENSLLDKGFVNVMISLRGKLVNDCWTSEVLPYCVALEEWLGVQCKDHPMQEIYALGHMVDVHGHLTLICPECAVPTVFDPHNQFYGEHGYVCAKCTWRYREAEEKKQVVPRPPPPPRAEVNDQCDVCHRPVRKGRITRRVSELDNFRMCFRHNWHGFKTAWEKSTLSVARNPDCPPGECRCDNLKSTCDGEWNKPSLAKIARWVDANRRLRRKIHGR